MNRIFSCHFLHYLITLSFISQSLVYGQSFITTDHAQIQHLAPKSITQAAKEESTSPAVPAIPKNFRQIIESDPRFAAAYADAPESIKTASSEEEQEKLFLEYLNSQLTSLIKTAEENEEKEIQQYRRVLLLFKKEERALAQLKRLAPKKERALSELYESNHQEAQAAYADFSHVRTSPTALTVSSFQEAFSVAMIIRDLTSSLLFTSKLPEKTLERQKILTRQRFIQLQKTKAVQSLPVIVTSIRKADEEEFKALALHGVTVKYTESSRVDYANELHSNSMKEYRKQTKPAEEAKPERKAQEKTPEQLVSLARKAFFSTYRTTMREGKLREQLQKIIQYQKEQSSIRVLYQRDINQMWAPLTDAINRTRATYETLYAHASASLRSAQEATAAFRESNDASERFLHEEVRLITTALNIFPNPEQEILTLPLLLNELNDQLIELLTDAGRTEQADTALYEQYLTISQEEVTLLGRIKGQGKEIDPNLLAQYKTTHEECRKLYSQFIALTGPNRATVIAYQKALNCALTIRNLCEPYKNDLDRTKRRAYTDAVRNVEAVVTHIRRANELAGENAAAIADIFLEEPIPSRATMAHETSSSAAMAYIDLESTQKANERYQEIVAQVRDAERSLEEARQAIAEDTRLLEDLTRFQKQIEEMIQSGEVLSAELRENLDNDTSVKAWQTAHEQANQAHMLEASSKINLAIQATRSYGISQDPDKLQLYESVNMLDKQNRALFDGGERMAQGLNATARLHLLRNLIREREYQLRYQTLLSMIEVKAEGLSFPLSLDEQGQDYIDLLLQLPSLASAWLDANEKTLQSAKKINEAGIIADAVQRQKSFWTDQSVLFAQAKKIVELAKLSDEAANKYEGELTAAIEQNPPEVGEKAVQYRRTVYNTLDLYNTAKLYLQTLVQYATSQTAYADDPELNALREAVANPGTAVRNYTFRFVNLPSVDAKRRAEAAEKLMPPDQLMEDARQAVQKAQAASEKDAQLLASLNRDTASEKTFREQWNSNTWYGYLVMLRFDATEWQKANTDANRAWQEAERKIKVAQEAVATYLRSPEPAKAGLFQAVQELSQTSSAIADIAQRKTKGEAILAKIPFLQALQQELARQAEYTAVLSQVVSGTQALSFPLQADAVNRDYIDHLMQLLDAVKAWLDANQETLKLANEIIDPAEEKVIGETQQRLNDFWTDNSLLFATAMNIMDQAKNAERAAEEYRVDLAIAQSSWAAGADELGNKCRATVSNALVLWKTAKEYLETILTYAGLDKSQYDTSDVTSIKMPLREPENPITEVLTNEIAVAIERMESIAQQLTTTVAPSSEAPATAPPPLAPPSPPSPPVQPPTAPPVDPNAAIDQTPQFQERVDRSREQAALTPAPDVDPVRTAQLKKAALHPAARTAVQLITGKFITALMKFAVPSTRGSDTELRQLIEATKAEMDRCFKEGGQELTETESMLMFRTLFGTYISQLAPNLADLLTHLQEYLPQPPQVPAPDLHPPSATAA